MPDARTRTASRMLAEVGIIVFSVLAALAANEWRQSLARNATVTTVRETIRTETEANREQVERALTHHRDMVAQLRAGGIEVRRFPIREAGLDTTSAAALGRTLTAIARREGAPITGDLAAQRLPDGRWQLAMDDGHLWLTVAGDTAVLRCICNISLRPPFLVDTAWETAQITQAAVHMDPDLVAALARSRQLRARIEGTVDRLIDFLYGTTTPNANPISALQDLVTFEQLLVEAYDDLLGRL